VQGKAMNVLEIKMYGRQILKVSYMDHLILVTGFWGHGAFYIPN
jgi:hypothetical protein